MDLTLQINGKPKTYTTGFVSARMVRQTLAMAKNINFEDLSPEELDQLTDYVVELFGRQFTRDELYDGLASQELLPTIEGCIQGVVGTLGQTRSDEGKNG